MFTEFKIVFIYLFSIQEVRACHRFVLGCAHLRLKKQIAYAALSAP